MRINLIIALLFASASLVSAQQAVTCKSSIGDHQTPAYFINDVQTDSGGLSTLNLKDLAVISIRNPKEAAESLGTPGAHSTVYLYTREFARVRNWRFLRSKSEEYKALIDAPERDSIAQYVVDGNPLSATEATVKLFYVTETNFCDLKIEEKKPVLSAAKDPVQYIIRITTAPND